MDDTNIVAGGSDDGVMAEDKDADVEVEVAVEAEADVELVVDGEVEVDIEVEADVELDKSASKTVDCVPIEGAMGVPASELPVPRA